MLVNDIYNYTNTLIDSPQFSTQTWYQYIKSNADNYIQIHFDYYRVMEWVRKRDKWTEQQAVEYIKQIVNMCLISNAYTFEKLYETTQLEYNPLWNVDGVEVTERIYASDNKNVQDIATLDATTQTLSSQSSNTTTNNLNSRESVTSQPSSTLYLKNSQDNTGTVHDVARSDDTLSNSVSRGGDITDTRRIDDTEKITHTRTGNIGVTKSTDLIDSQRKTVDFNFLKYVCHKIICEFCRLVD